MNREWLYLPNLLGYLRALAGVSLYFLLSAEGLAVHGTALVLFIIAAMTDYWDGWIARRYGLETPIGKFVDADVVVVPDVRRRAHDLDAIPVGLLGHLDAVCQIRRAVVQPREDVTVQVDHRSSVRERRH